MIHPQTQRAIDKLLEAGLTRDQFSVKAERKYVTGSRAKYGKAQYEYGRARIRIILKSPSVDLMPYVEAMARAGLRVIVTKFEDGLCSVRAESESESEGCLFEYSYLNKDEYGLPVVERVI